MKGGGFRWQARYAALPDALFARQAPEPVSEPALVLINEPLAADMGLDADWLRSAAGAALLAGNDVPDGATPIAQAYAGHQFGHFTMLGDGRAILLGEHVAPDGKLLDVQLKGSGRTPFSRSGDGRAALGPMLREYLISEAMERLGIPTTRSLAVVATGERILRQDGPLPGAVLTRVAASHVRVGTVQYAAAQADPGILPALMEHVRSRHYPHVAGGNTGGLFGSIMVEQSALIALWMGVGFVHGVMNTDNMALSGETIDYGPCAFMDRYDPETVFSSIDHHGRYAWGEQPRIAQWNLARLAEALLPLFAPDREAAVEAANAELKAFPALFEAEWLAILRRKLGMPRSDPGDLALAERWLAMMHRQRADWTNTFRALSIGQDPGLSADPDWSDWEKAWRNRAGDIAAAQAIMSSVNPAIIPRNHKVEEAIDAAVAGDMAPFNRLLEAFDRMFEDDPRDADLTQPGPDAPFQTFCGT